MPKCTGVESWRACTPQEVLEFYEPAAKGEHRTGGILIVRKRLRPVDVYAYLRARFGQPNGFQNVLRKDDSDNWIHWDYNIRADDVDIHIAGMSREIHFQVREALTDEDWKNLIVGIRSDFARVAADKSAMLHSFEKFVVFQNKFVALSGLCADLHASIVDAPPFRRPPRMVLATGKAGRAYKRSMKRISERGNRLYGDCLKLRLLTPIMAEAFINMIILVFCKSEIRNDRAAYESLVREHVPERIKRLSIDCFGFQKAVDKSTEAYVGFMRVINKRNFALHGNVNPVSDRIEVVYFEGKRPLYVDPGNHIGKFFEQLEEQHMPDEVIRDYESVHAFLAELTGCLSPASQRFFNEVISDPYPGYELKRRRVTRLFPNHLMMGGLPGLRDDEDLKVAW